MPAMARKQGTDSCSALKATGATCAAVAKRCGEWVDRTGGGRSCWQGMGPQTMWSKAIASNDDRVIRCG